MRIALGSDHAGLTLKAAIRAHLETAGHQVADLGAYETASTDYPDHAHKVTDAVVSGEAERGILVCGTGQGMAMTANKVPGVRAAVVADPFSAEMAMLHNNAKVLCLGERVVGAAVALQCVDAWVGADFEGGRHQRRVAKMESGS